METLIISGVGANGAINPGPYQGIQVESIELDVPLDEVGSSDPSIILTGATTGTYTFHNSVSPHLRFYKDETVTISGANFSGEYSAIINYLTYGSQETWKQKKDSATWYQPARLTTRPAYDAAHGFPTN